MPEGHVTHRIAGEINRHFGGREVRSSSPQGRFSESAARLDGQVLTEATAYGKHMFVAFDGIEDEVNIHLGLIGKFFFAPALDPASQRAVRWRLESDEPQTMDLTGPNICALRTPGEKQTIIGRLGADPLRADADPERAWARILHSPTPIGVLMMDQKVFAGVGNIYRAEVLFRHHLDPKMPGRFLRRAEFDKIWQDLVLLMPLGVRDGRIDTVYPEHTPEAMGRPPREDAHGGEVYVYRRAGQSCLVCGTSVRATELAGRNLFWCPTCQPRSRRRTANPR